MRERLWADMTDCHALQAIIANRRCGAQARGDVAAVNDLALLRRVTPDARKTIGLQLESHRQAISHRGFATAQVADLLFDPENLLDVVSDLVRDNVRLSELAWRAEPGAQLIEERQIDVDLLIGGTVERPGGGLRGAASAVGVVAE
jgi:hypothetical protein